MPVVWSDDHRLHDPGGEVWLGVRIPGAEVPERAERIREALTRAGGWFVEAEAQPDNAVTSVHDADLTAYLASAWDEWEAAGLPDDPGIDRVVPYVFAHPDLLSGRPARTATSITARTGQFAYDTMTLIGPGTWEAARAAVDSAVTAADLVLDDAPAAYACTRRRQGRRPAPRSPRSPPSRAPHEPPATCPARSASSCRRRTGPPGR